MRSLCAERAAPVQARSRRVSTMPPAAATRCASDGVRSTTITRWPSATRGSDPTRPRQANAAGARTGVCPALLPPVVSTTAVAATATSASRTACRGSARGVGIEPKITGVRDSLGEPGRRGDHRRVVGAQLERRERGVAPERGSQLRVRRHTADDRDSAPAVLPRRLADATDECAHDRALVRGGEVGAAALQLLRAQLAGDGEEGRLEAGEGEGEPGNARA